MGQGPAQTPPGLISYSVFRDVLVYLFGIFGSVLYDSVQSAHQSGTEVGV